MSMYQFIVPSMSCAECLSKVNTAISKLDPDAKLEADFQDRRLVVNSDLNEMAVIEALTGAGFPPVP
jgi:copper chaperone CopZ